MATNGPKERGKEGPLRRQGDESLDDRADRSELAPPPSRPPRDLLPPLRSTVATAVHPWTAQHHKTGPWGSHQLCITLSGVPGSAAIPNRHTTPPWMKARNLWPLHHPGLLHTAIVQYRRCTGYTRVDGMAACNRRQDEDAVSGLRGPRVRRPRRLLAQMWAGFVLKTGARLLGKTGLGQPTDDYRSLAIVTLLLVLLLLTFDNMELHKVAGGIAVAPYL